MITSYLWLAKLRNVQTNCEVNNVKGLYLPNGLLVFYVCAILKSIYYRLGSFFSAVPSTSHTLVATWKVGCMTLGRAGVYFVCMMWNYVRALWEDVSRSCLDWRSQALTVSLSCVIWNSAGDWFRTRRRENRLHRWHSTHDTVAEMSCPYVSLL
jgi:hypothetical protein